jgi:hypothetical protein
MSEITQATPLKGKRTFYDQVAWCCFLTPVVTPAVVCAALYVANRLHYDNFISPIFAGEFFILVVGVLLGIVSLLGLGRHTRRVSLWIALMGIVVGFGVGYADLVLLAMSAMGRNC